MKRRAFFHKAAAFVFGCALGVGALKHIPEESLAECALESIPNPEWVNAPYEVHFWLNEDTYNAINIGPPPKEVTPVIVKRESPSPFFSVKTCIRLNHNGKVILP